MKPTVEELEKIDRDRKNEKYRIKYAIKLNICPECGKDLATEMNKFTLFRRWDYKVYCPFNTKHYEAYHFNYR